MSMVAPTSKWLQQKARLLSNQAFSRQKPMVYYLGAGGRLLAAIDTSEVDRSELLARRTELLAQHKLKAIVEVLPLLPGVLQMSMVEAFNGSQTIDVHALVTWPAHQRWIPVPKDAQARWHEHWV